MHILLTLCSCCRVCFPRAPLCSVDLADLRVPAVVCMAGFDYTSFDRMSLANTPSMFGFSNVNVDSVVLCFLFVQRIFKRIGTPVKRTFENLSLFLICGGV